MTKIKLKTQWLNPVELLTSPINPRTIDEEQFEKLKASLSAFPEMMEIRPIVINAENEVLGGNMRLLAAIDLKWPKVPVIDVSALPIEKQKEFMIRDNVQHGQWDYDMLANEWESDTLNDWGLAVWSPDGYSDFEPNLNPTFGHEDVTEKEINQKAKELADRMKSQATHQTIICPHCQGEFEIEA